MNKIEVIRNYLKTIELSISHRELEQQFDEQTKKWTTDDTAVWYVNYAVNRDHDHIYWYLDNECPKFFYKKYRTGCEISILGQYWSFSAATDLTTKAVIEMVRSVYREVLESLEWCDDHQCFFKDYCIHCDEEEFESGKWQEFHWKVKAVKGYIEDKAEQLTKLIQGYSFDDYSFDAVENEEKNFVSIHLFCEYNEDTFGQTGRIGSDKRKELHREILMKVFVDSPYHCFPDDVASNIFGEVLTYNFYTNQATITMKEQH